ncbi:MAG TPA: AMP-binding protein, partial [Cyclobacteriaceae bacterium]
MTEPNLADYDSFLRSFHWDDEASLNGLRDGPGLNIAHEAIDRHATGLLKDHIALRWIRKDRSVKDFTYYELHELSNRFANVLTTLGVTTGETVFTLTGRIPELYVTALGTLKKTAVFCPLFSAFGPEPVYQRLIRGDAKVLVTTLELYTNKVKALLQRLPALKCVLLTDTEEDLNEKVLSLPLLMEKASLAFTIPPTQPGDAALLHFTSGTTGMPKGALHVHHAVVVHYMTGKFVLDFHPDDVYWCTADPGWVTGTSYGIISPLVNGVTNIVDEEEFDAARWYSILEEHKVGIWYTAPTAIRRLMRMNIKPRKQYNLEHLRLVLSVGEPLHADAVRWAQETFEVPVLDNWWQTETGGIMISNYRSMRVKPGSMGKPLPGVEA